VSESRQTAIPGPETPDWVFSPSDDPRLVRVRETLLTVADGRFGTRAVAESTPVDGRADTVVAGGAYGPEPPGAILAAPDWTRLGLPAEGGWTMDLRDAVVRTRGPSSLRFAVATRPGTAVLRAAGPVEDGPRLLAPHGAPASARVAAGPAGEAGTWMAVDSGGCVVAAAVRDLRTGGATERIVGLARAASLDDAVASARRRLEDAAAAGGEALLAEHRARWAQRWDDAFVEIDGDPRAELAVRFAVVHLLSSATADGESAVGARGLTGPGYVGHVFWDSDVFVLPALVALDPAAARSLVDYRLRRLPAARDEAAARGLPGARFPWESAGSGRDVTPRSGTDPTGRVVPILTGEREEHITADVAWALVRCAEWTGDDVAGGPGRELLVETARYWAARVEPDPAGRFHLRHVIGPDEYHEDVDDNAYTNALARWNLRAAARVATAGGAAGAEAAAWSRIADRLVDGLDPAAGRHHQFAGFDSLEPVIISRLADPPVAADILLGHPRVHASQVIKQADVLMGHLVVPDEMDPRTLAADIDFALPRTAHGSSLSPAVHAAVLARAGRPEEALRWFDTAAAVDLDDLTGTTAAGIHLGAMGGLWQALAFGFLGVRGRGAVLHLDPVLPRRWRRVRVVLTYRGSRIETAVTHTECTVTATPEAAVRLSGTPPRRGGTLRFRRGERGWEEA